MTFVGEGTDSLLWLKFQASCARFKKLLVVGVVVLGNPRLGRDQQVNDGHAQFVNHQASLDICQESSTPAERESAMSLVSCRMRVKFNRSAVIRAPRLASGTHR